MKIWIAQQNYHIGNFEANTQKIIAAIQQAEAAGAQLVLFSELCICGYPPRDFLEFENFLEQCTQSLEALLPYTKNIGVLVGAPAKNTQPLGKDLFNAAYYLYQEKIQQVIHKTLLPTYDVFDEYRYFEPAFEWQIIQHQGTRIAVTICEDVWNLGENPLYRICPLDKLLPQQPQIIVNLSASPFDYTHHEDRLAILKANVSKYQLPFVYCNTVGSQTEIVFDGGSLAFDKAGNVCAQLATFTEDAALVEILPDGSITNPIVIPAAQLPQQELQPATLQPTLHIEKVYQALVLGIQDYFQKMGFTKAILGSSGGIDSAVVLAIACQALGPQNVTAVLLPSQYSSEHSITDAELLSKQLENPYYTIPIQPSFDTLLQTVQPHFNNLPFSLAEENMQSRLRGNILMALSNKHGYILLNTSNKSELSTGYGTLYGDMAGGISVLGDCYKTQVYALAKYINREREIIPNNILEKAPSAELRPNQKDSDSLPDYDILDAILYQYIEHRKGPEQIIAQGFDAALVHKTLQMVNRNEYKRNQFCPIIRVSPKAFGVGRRMPIVGKYLG
ncbi:MAG: NAD+ synthase [Bacteroidetes bacterium]|nr:MAG: NAD+ synthase [Bacteroidota bacterium]